MTMTKIKAGVAAATVVLVAMEWLMISHALSWAVSAVLPQ
jgi:hypothetical protein